MGEIAIMNGTGDTKILWDPQNEDEVENARKTFDDLVTRKRFAAFDVTGKKGEKGERVTWFNPEAGRLILVPPMAGG